MMRRAISERGQFFSPDLIIGILIFVTVSSLFFITVSSLSAQVSLMEMRGELEEASHPVITSLVTMPGQPFNWESAPLGQIRAFGLASSNNVMDEKKIDRFISLLDANYYETKSLLGLGFYDFKLELVDAAGNVVEEGGFIPEDLRMKFVYERVVFYEDQRLMLRGVVSLAD